MNEVTQKNRLVLLLFSIFSPLDLNDITVLVVRTGYVERSRTRTVSIAFAPHLQFIFSDKTFVHFQIAFTPPLVLFFERPQK